MSVQHATMTSYYRNGSEVDITECEVRFANNLTEIFVSYKNHEPNPPHVLYSGRCEEAGHYQLRSENPESDATLHCASGSRKLVGFWTQGVRSGTWVIDLPKPPADTIKPTASDAQV